MIPPKPILRFEYKCDKRFHTNSIRDLLNDDDKFGFIIISGDTTVLGTVCGSSKQKLVEFEADLPKKHPKGGQSSVRFARLRVEKRHNYLRKVSELCTLHFITDNKPNIKGIILAGFAGFKNEFMDSNLYDPRLKAVTLKILDIAYGGDFGFNQAIELAADTLSNVKMTEHRKIISEFFTEIAKDSRKICFGPQETITALETGVVDTLILWEELKIQRTVLLMPDGSSKTIYTKPDAEPPNEGKIIESELLTEWFAQNYTRFGIRLAFVTDESPEGSQFCKGFGGLGALLRYEANLTFDLEDEAVNSNNLEDDFI